MLLENKSKKTLIKLARKGIQSVHNAWYYLTENHKHGDFIDDLSPEVVRYVNGLVQGGAKEDGNYRSNEGKMIADNVTLNIKGFTPVGADKVPGEVNKVLARTKEKYGSDKLESAIYAHLALAMTQPFRDGNKRTARLIQDRILHDAELPPAVITAGEGQFYMDLIRRTAPAYAAEDLDEQRQFYDYCASKVNNGLDEILEDIFEE